MIYRILFAEPVWYQPSHPTARRQISHLDVVGAPSEADAIIHAYRTLPGVLKIARVLLIADKRDLMPPPLDTTPMSETTLIYGMDLPRETVAKMLEAAAHR